MEDVYEAINWPVIFLIALFMRFRSKMGPANSALGHLLTSKIDTFFTAGPFDPPGAHFGSLFALFGTLWAVFCCISYLLDIFGYIWIFWINRMPVAT